MSDSFPVASNFMLRSSVELTFNMSVEMEGDEIDSGNRRFSSTVVVCFEPGTFALYSGGKVTT